MENIIRLTLITVLLAISAFGFVNAFYLKHDGPGGDLGVVAGLLAVVVYVTGRALGSKSTE